MYIQFIHPLKSLQQIWLKILLLLFLMVIRMMNCKLTLMVEMRDILTTIHMDKLSRYLIIASHVAMNQLVYIELCT
uniref:Uncharacterized protein n=1 Tax=Cucumis melo TaxID=3656 RepID=A0A9I9DDV9_CUCME